MAETRSYPPVGDPDRYDRIVRRGRSMRRRRQLGAGLGAGGGVAAAALAVVLLTSGNSNPTDQVVADDDGTEIVTTTTASTTTSTTLPPTELTLELDATAQAITVVVIDPERPVDPESRQCVTVSVHGESGSTAEAYGCDDIPAVEGTVDLDLRETDGVLIGCSSMMVRPDDDADPKWETEVSSTTFRLVPPVTLAPGEYTVDVGVTSGIGDGCAQTGDEAGPDEPLGAGTSERSLVESTTIRMG